MNLIKTVKKREISLSFRRKFILCNCMLTFFDATKFYETQHTIYTHSPHPSPVCIGETLKCHSPTRATLDKPTFHTFPYKTWRTVEKQKVGSARRVTWLAGQPLWCKVTCSLYKQFGSLSRSTRSKRDNFY